MNDIPADQYQYDSPARTLELLDSLVSEGFPDSAFAKLHHFKVPETIARHRRYCEELVDEEARFRTNSNRLVQRRLELVLNLLRVGPILTRTAELFALLAKVAMLEFPNDPLPLSEQYAENEKRDKGSAA